MIQSVYIQIINLKNNLHNLTHAQVHHDLQMIEVILEKHLQKSGFSEPF